ncbi:MAG: alpha-galactosidase [Lentisphaeria bacterium]|nr:alpha-galactosidase [Lentisphaeria bacterium]
MKTELYPPLGVEAELTGTFDARWKLELRCETPADGIRLLKIACRAPEALPPPAFTINWSIPMRDVQGRWTTGSLFKNLPADWAQPLVSQLTAQAPVMAFFSHTGKNRLTFAASECVRLLELHGGVSEENCRIGCSIAFFTSPGEPLSSYDTEIRFDFRGVNYADAIREAFAELSGQPLPAPPSAFDPVYSTWYGFHHNFTAEAIEKEAALARGYGMRTIIVDDGWETGDNSRSFEFTGDWRPEPRRIPDMRGHIRRIRSAGMNYLLWYAPPFAGDGSEAARRFRGKFLFRRDRMKCSVLDPRFPEVRDYLVRTLETAFRDWEPDGIKIDFIDCFRIEGNDPAVEERYAGRDMMSVPLAAERLLDETITCLRRIRPGLLVEFRQSYIGPAIRRYGNLLRAGDCPGDILSNRVRTIDLRLGADGSAIHSDMLEFHPDEPPESAALQLLNVLFAVPQISVKLSELSAVHRDMLHFWLGFASDHRETLLKGRLLPQRPDLNYPVVRAAGSGEEVIAVYNASECIVLPTQGTALVVNASGGNAITVDAPAVPAAAELRNVTGRLLPAPEIPRGLSRINIPPAGLLTVSWK